MKNGKLFNAYALHLIKFIYLKNRIEIRSVKAGPTQEHMGCCIEPYHISAFDTFYHNGKKLSPKKFTVARVDGDCIEISPFNAITLSGSADIIYQQDANTHFEIYGSDNIISILKIYVDKNTLFIKYPNNINIRDRGTLEIRVSSPELNSMGINGSGNIQLTNSIQTKKNVEVNINGSGDISCNVSEKLSAQFTGGGSLSYKGNPQEVYGPQKKLHKLD